MVVGCEVLHQDETGDPAEVSKAVGLGSSFLLLMTVIFSGLLVSLMMIGGGQLVRSGSVGAEATLNKGVHRRDLGEDAIVFGGSQQRGEEPVVDDVPQPATYCR